MARVYHVINHAEMMKILSSPQGTVARDLLRRALKVESAAKRNLGSNPKRVDTGRLRASLTHEFATTGRTRMVARIGTNVKHARFVHDGTGLYGPRHALIVPKSKKALRWTAKGGRGKKGYVFSKYSRGMKPNPFLKNALPSARGL